MTDHQDGRGAVGPGTALPWRIRGDDETYAGTIQGAPEPLHKFGFLITNRGGLSHPKTIGAANARFIVHAANNHHRLVEALEGSREALQAMMDAWLDYHDAHSLTQPVTGAAGNAFDKALAARDGADEVCRAARGEETP